MPGNIAIADGVYKGANDKEEVYRCPKSTLQADAWFLLLQHDSFCAMVQLTRISIVQCELVQSVQMCT